MIPKRYPVVIEPTSTGYSAFSPDLPGCAAAGDTEEETRWNFKDALVAHFEIIVRLANRFLSHGCPLTIEVAV